MKRDNKKKPNKLTKDIPTTPQPVVQKKNIHPGIWMLFIAGITALVFSPMLGNGFTNWDDEGYILANGLLRGPDWKGIFTQQVVGNYHPLTILSLALNYALTELNPFSYVLFNLLLHVTNTLLVFYFIWILSEKKTWIAVFTALLFGLHPMHVESVAWISERKDVLYTLFFLLSLIQYWRYLNAGKILNYWLSFIFFILSIVSKPAAIVLPLVLFLLDYWKGRSFNRTAFRESRLWRKVIIEKIPFFIVSVAFAVITLKIQSQTAVAGLDVYPLWMRLFFAFYVVMIYSIRFFIPYPLSAFHPYPDPGNLGPAILLSPVFAIVLFILLWRQRRNRLVVFSILFFLVNLLLVLQIVSIGYTIVSERYTYVPYIGLAFLFAMWLVKDQTKSSLFRIILFLIVLVFGVVSFQRTKVWKNSGTLWSNVIKQYKDAAVPRGNHAHYLSQLASENTDPLKANSLYLQVIDDCSVAIKTDPGLYMAYKTRGLTLLQLNRYQEALADADSLLVLTPETDPDHSLGYSMRGTANMNLNQFQKALDDFNKRLATNPGDDGVLNKRGAVLYNGFRKYDEALTDFNKAIKINSQKGSYYLNRSRCYYWLGSLDKARDDAEMAIKKGEKISDEFRKLLNM